MIAEIKMLRPTIINQLGPTAWAYISAGSPTIANGYVFFWVYSQECCWGIDTDPVLLMQIEGDREFETFDELITELFTPFVAF